ncbi:MAG: twin-arginine translocase subunit TatC [Gemmataceae bacterium]
MSSNGTPHDPEDFFSETRMTFGDHLDDLRRHLLRAVAGFCVVLFFCFFIGEQAVEFITAPVKEQLHAYNKRRAEKTKKDLQDNANLQKVNEPSGFTLIYLHRGQFKAVLEGKSTEEIEAFKRPVWASEETKNDERSWFDRILNRTVDKEDNPDEQRVTKKDVVGIWMASAEPLTDALHRQQATRIANDLDSMSTFNIMEAFMVWFKVCLVCGFVLGSPWIFWQIWMFVAAGLYPHEKRLVHVYLPVSLGLFLLGVLMCQFLVIPRAIEALLWFNEWLGIKPDMRLNEWLSFAIWMPVIFGVSFQTPLVMMFVARLGILNAESFRSKRRYAWMGLAVFAAIITPTPDALTMMFLWVPMCLLYELGIWLIKMSPNEPELGDDVPQSEEMIEV